MLRFFTALSGKYENEIFIALLAVWNNRDFALNVET